MAKAQGARIEPHRVSVRTVLCCCSYPQVSPDERFDEILGVSDTYIPAANVWVGEYPYLDKVSNPFASKKPPTVVGVFGPHSIAA